MEACNRVVHGVEEKDGGRQRNREESDSPNRSGWPVTEWAR